MIPACYPVARLAVSMTLFGCIGCGGVRLAELDPPRTAPPEGCLVVGLLGGMDAWDDSTKGVRRLALELRDPAAGLRAETFENRRAGRALAFVRRALDADGNGDLSPREARRLRLVIYGQSLGGGAAVALARQLALERVPVELLVLIDSVGRNDGVVPPNVRRVANLYQDDGWFIAGENPVRPRRPAATRVVLQREFEYDRPPGSTIDIGDLPWYKKAFRVAHARMDRDPRVWAAVERLVRDACAR